MVKTTAFEEMIQEYGLRFDEQGKMGYGTIRGIRYCVMMDREGYARVRTAISVQHNGQAPVEQEIKDFAKGCKSLGNVEVDGHRILILTMAPTHKGCLEKTRKTIEELSVFLSTNGYSDCCEQCGTADGIGAYIIGDAGHHLCQSCFDSIEHTFANDKLVKSKRKSNLIAGIVGALLGSLVGVFAIVVIGQLGYVAALSGVVMGVCALKGYELLGGKLTTVGIIISCVIMAAMVYFGNSLDWALLISSELEMGIFDSLRIIPALLEEEIIESSSYLGNIGMLYLFTAVGAYPTIMSSLRNKDGNYEARPAA